MNDLREQTDMEVDSDELGFALDVLQDDMVLTRTNDGGIRING